MKVTRDVITDLLPLYFSDEASADTRALVDAYFAIDPDFARRARTHPEASLPQAALPQPTEETEMLTLQRTRKLLNLRATVQGLAFFLTLLPLTFFVDSKTGVHWLFLDKPAAMAIIIPLAVIAWGAYLTLRHRLRSSGV